MISDEGFLSALSLGGGEQRPSPFPSAIPLSGTPSPVRDASALLSYTEAMTPNLYSALSASATYPSAYLSDPYISSAASASHAVPPPLSSNPYTYGSWTAPAPPLRSAVAAGPSAEAEARAALSEAERQRQILQLERELAEEQRQRLEARLSPLSSSAARLSVSVPCGRTPSSEAAGDASRYGGSEASSSPPPECAHDEVGEELRAFSMEAPAPPSSPSPPSAHVQARLYVRGANGGVDACGPPAAASKRPQEQPAEPSAPPSPFLATPAAAANGLAKGSAVSPQPHPSKTPSPQRSSPQPEQCASAPITRAGASSPSPQRALVRSEERRTSQRPAPSPPPSEGDGSRASPRKPNSAQRAVTDMHEDEEQRLYEAYKQKLARIQEALRPPSGTGVLCATASFEACRAHQRRYRLTTPALWSSTPPALPSSSPPLRTTGELPLVRRAPSTGSYADPVAPLSCGRQRQLRWDIAHSGNIVVSSDGYVCKADATDALALIEREYEGRLEDVLQRLVIPFYAMGNLGLTRGSLTFAVRRAPALAFGFATRAFTGYGTEAPAFLYLSTGAIAQGVSTTTSAGAERPYGAPYAPGSELAARLDLEHGELEFYVEGVSMGVAFRFCPARHPAPLFPVAVFSAEMDLAELLYSA
ncbi:hypothetical protein CGC20_27080 [Leishmania donovani]|uniref:B30.2/SPRY domain-containing protein n=1 Tax=Leishmania donovani TaxID=5661 RepID=A0A504XV32_LEIDO|nr:hypothetical protein CGC20_27080 [Leishmania donovani]